MNITFANAASRKLPILLSEAKDHLQVSHDDDDMYIRALVGAATRQAENYTKRKFITDTLTMDLDANEALSPLVLPYAPFGAITSFVEYTSDEDTTGTAVSSSNYRVDGTNPARIIAINGGWQFYRAYKSHRIVYTAGYGTGGDDVPEDILQAIKIMIADMWYNPESAKLETRTQLNPNLLPTAARALLDGYIVHVY